MLRAQSIQDPRSEAALRGMSEEQKLGSWHVAVGDTVYSGGAGAAPLFERLAFGRPLAAFARRFPRITDRVYRFIANRRDRFGLLLGEAACAVDPSARQFKEEPFVGG